MIKLISTEDEWFIGSKSGIPLDNFYKLFVDKEMTINDPTDLIKLMSKRDIKYFKTELEKWLN